MNSTDPRCENCGDSTTESSLTASAALPGWIRGPYCAGCALIAFQLVAEHPDGPELFDAPE